MVQVTSLLVHLLGASPGEGEGSCHWKERLSKSRRYNIGFIATWGINTVSTHPFLQENPEVFGYLLGGIAAFGSWASRIPPFSNIVSLGWGLGFWVM